MTEDEAPLYLDSLSVCRRWLRWEVRVQMSSGNITVITATAHSFRKHRAIVKALSGVFTVSTALSNTEPE